jgi:hypothetical protein
MSAFLPSGIQVHPGERAISGRRPAPVASPSNLPVGRLRVKPDKALPQLRYYVMNAVPLVARDADEAAKVMDSRFVIAQLLASIGDIEAAIAEMRAVRPLLAAAYGPESAQVHNLDKQAARLQPAPDKTS